MTSSGAEGDRTPDLMTASHALSHLSYSPIFKIRQITEIYCACQHYISIRD